MCGITGIWHLDRQRVDQAKITRFNDSLTHRGPDGYGTRFYENETLALGHRRLSILDLTSAGKQPMVYADAQLSITFNGEIFNFMELRVELKKLGYQFRSDTDTEVVLAAYHKWGKECFHRFNGMWAMAIWDERKKELLLSRDRFGIKPLYYVHVPRKLFAFASETLAFKYLDGFTRGIDEDLYNASVEDPMLLEGEGMTVFKDIVQVLPGHLLCLPGDLKIGQVRWWHIDDYVSDKSTLSAKSQAEELKSLLVDSCRLRMQSDVKIGTALSGGLDSSVIMSIVNDLLKKGTIQRSSQSVQEVFTITFPGLANDERIFAEEAFSYTSNAKHHLIEADTDSLINQIVNDTRIADYVGNWPLTSASLVYKTMKAAGVTVSLDGHGVDEMMYGYKGMISSLFYNAIYDSRKSADTYAQVLKGFSDDAGKNSKIDQLLNEKELRDSSLIHRLKQVLKGKSSISSSQKKGFMLSNSPYNFNALSFEDRIIYEEFFKTRLPTLLRNFDRASMINSVEVRMPFLDWRIVCLLFSLPMSLKINSGYTKYLLRESMKGSMNENIRLRTTKVGIVSPIEHWFKNGLSDWMIDQIDDRKVKMLLEAAKASGQSLSSEQIKPAWQIINRKIIENNG